jgi:hypothetical protein
MGHDLAVINHYANVSKLLLLNKLKLYFVSSSSTQNVISLKFDFRRKFLLCILDIRLKIQSWKFLRKSNLNEITQNMKSSKIKTRLYNPNPLWLHTFWISNMLRPHTCMFYMRPLWSRAITGYLVDWDYGSSWWVFILQWRKSLKSQLCFWSNGISFRSCRTFTYCILISKLGKAKKCHFLYLTLAVRSCYAAFVYIDSLCEFLNC